MTQSGEIPRSDIDQALAILKGIVPAAFSIEWDYLEAATSVQFVLKVADQTESMVWQTYAEQIVPQLSELIRENDDPLRWMVLFQDPTGHFITDLAAYHRDAI